MLGTRECPRNVASTSSLVSNPTSTPSSAASVMGRSTLVAPSAGLEGVVEHVADYSMDNNGAVRGICGVVFSLVLTPPPRV